MATSTVVQTSTATLGEVSKLLGHLKIPDVKKLVLVGEGGVGKTWMAEQVSQLAFKDGLTCGTIWIYPVEKIDKNVLLESIVSQLAVLSNAEEWDDEDKEEPKNREKEVEILKRKIAQKLKVLKSVKNRNITAEETGVAGLKRSTAGENKRFLLVVLDDATDNGGRVDQLLEDILSKNHFKVLITRKGNADPNERNDDNIEPVCKIVSIDRLTSADSLSLLQKRVNRDISGNQKFKDLSQSIVEKCCSLPAAIIMAAELFNRSKDLDLDLEVAMVDAAGLDCGQKSIGSLLRFVYENLPTDSIRRCFWFSRLLFLHRGTPIHYNELITYWLLEGCLDHHESISNAYAEGHSFLMELRDRGILVGQKNYVYMEKEIWRIMDDAGEIRFTDRVRLGLASLRKTDTWDAFKKITLGDGMMKTISRGRKQREEISALVIDGNRLSREDPEVFFRSVPKLRILAILNPEFDSLDKILPLVKDLQVLVLRGCHFLKSINQVKELTKLSVLEVSGASSLEDLDDDLFKEMKEDLESVNLTGLKKIETVPNSLSECVQLRLLLLRDCPEVTMLPSFRGLPNLEIVDISGSKNIEKLPDGNIRSLKNLHTLIFSRTKVRNFPIVQGLTRLKHIVISGCSTLKILRDLSSMTGLKVIDLSGSSSIKDINGVSLKSLKHLQILDLSDSGITGLPEKMCSVSYLHLRGCEKLSGHISTQSLVGLEFMDLSGCVNFLGIKDELFDQGTYLRHLNLSGTKIKKLPPLSPLKEWLRKLLLKGCKELTALQNLSDLEKLEILDLSGCSNLNINQGESFKNMSRLRTLDLSETMIVGVAEDCFPANLCHIVLRNCTPIKVLPEVESLSKLVKLDLCGSSSLCNVKSDFLKTLSALQVLNLSELPIEELELSHFTKLQELSLKGCPCNPSGLEALKELKLLDLSETKATSLPSLEAYTNLVELRLRGCSDLTVLENLKSLTNLEVLDLSGTKLSKFPYEISMFTCLKELHLPDMWGIHEIDWTMVKRIPEEFNMKLREATSSANPTTVTSPYILISGTKFFSFLKTYPDLWDSCFKEFHFSIWLLNEQQGKAGVSKLPGDMSMSNYVNLKGRFPCHFEHRKMLEIHGHCDFSGGNGLLGELKDALTRAEHISVISNDGLTSMPKLTEDITASMKSCWLERCPEIHCIFSRQEHAAAFVERLNSLYLCNLSSLEKLFDANFSAVLVNLKNLYVDCCPELKTLLPSSKVVPRLQTLRVKFCYKLEAVFESAETPLPDLHTLELLALPKLNSIGAVLPAVKKFTVRECRGLKNLEETLAKAEKLENLVVCGGSGNLFPESFKNLKSLKIESCPDVVNILSSIETLERLEVKLCDQLKGICEGSSLGDELRLYLWRLPQLETIGFKLPKNSVIRDCPKLKIP